MEGSNTVTPAQDTTNSPVSKGAPSAKHVTVVTSKSPHDEASYGSGQIFVGNECGANADNEDTNNNDFSAKSFRKVGVESGNVPTSPKHRKNALSTTSFFSQHLLPVDEVIHENVECEAETKILAAVEAQQNKISKLYEQDDRQQFGLFHNNVIAAFHDKEKASPPRIPQLEPTDEKKSHPFDASGKPPLPYKQHKRINSATAVSGMSSILKVKNKFKAGIAPSDVILNNEKDSRGNQLDTKETSGLKRRHRRTSTNFSLGEGSKATSTANTLKREKASSNLIDGQDLTKFDSLGLSKKQQEEDHSFGVSEGSNAPPLHRILKKRGAIYEALRPDIIAVKVANFVKKFLLFMMPLLCLAFVLYEYAGNPIFWLDASLSWWCIFTVRLSLTWYLSNATEYIWIRCIVMRTKIVLQLCGPMVTLCLVQSRGWPFILTTWAIWDFILLFGGGSDSKAKFAEHWLYWQDEVDVFTEKNSSAGVLEGEFYQNMLIAAILVGVVTSLKRTSSALHFGRRTYAQYGEKVEKLLMKMDLLSDVAELAQAIYDDVLEVEGNGLTDTGKRGWIPKIAYNGFRRKSNDDVISKSNEDIAGLAAKELNGPDIEQGGKLGDIKKDNLNSSSGLPPLAPKSSNQRASDRSRHADLWNRYRAGTIDSTRTITSNRNKSHSETSDLTLDEKDDKVDDCDGIHRARPFCGNYFNIHDKLDEWEEPIIAGQSPEDLLPPILEVLKFRKSVRKLEDPYPFTHFFGIANTRQSCIDSAILIYERLMLKTPEYRELPFDTIGSLAVDEDGILDESKAKRLVRLFRADKSGLISAIAFAQSVDNVYKKMRLLLASLKNSQRLDHVLENILNYIFYVLLFFIVIAVLGFDPFSVLLSFTTILLSFTFAFGGAASKYTEGIISIVARRPFDVGDRIALSDPNSDTNPYGSATWIVEDLNIFFTTLCNGATNEVATISNYALANARIINCGRSYKARVLFPIKVGIATPNRTMAIFRSAVENYINDRPSKWAEFSAFRAGRIEPELGFIEYNISVMNQKKWQDMGAVLDDKHELILFCLETAKQLGIRYESPPLPVNVEVSAMTAAKTRSPISQEKGSPNSNLVFSTFDAMMSK